MRLLRGLAALAITVCVALAAVVVAGYGTSRSVGSEDRVAVPTQVYEPFGWQATVQTSPPGPATLLVSGAGWGMRGPVYRGKVAVLGESGVYRIQRYQPDLAAGEDVLLAPNGTALVDAVARKTTVEPTGPVGSSDPALWLTDLTSGRTERAIVSGSGVARPVAWSPDSRKVLVQVSGSGGTGPWLGGRLNLLDVRTGALSRVLDLGSEPVHRAQFAAFSPDGRQVAVQVGDAVLVVNVTTGVSRTLARLGADRRLAGVGAWSSDGRRIAVLTLAGCSRACDDRELDERRWQIDELDAGTGAALVGGYARLTGVAVRVLGQRPSGELAVVRYRAHDGLRSDSTGSLTIDGDPVEETDYRAVGDVELLGLRASGSQHTLVTLPPGARHVDVAAKLVSGGLFGGGSPRPMPWPAPLWVSTIAVVLMVVAVWLLLRIRRLTR